MKIGKAVAILLLGLVCSCSSNQPLLRDGEPLWVGRTKAQSPSEILALSDDAIGTDVVVDGVVRLGPEYAGIWDSYADIERANFRAGCVTLWDRDGKIPRFMTAEAKVLGTLLDGRKNRVIVLGSCGDQRVILVKAFKESLVGSRASG